MSDNPQPSFSLSLSTEHLTRPVTVLIQKLCDAVGVIYQPTHLRRMANAEADAALIAAKGELALNDLQRRALMRVIQEEASNQANIEAITDRAIPLIAETADPEQLDTDWLRLLFDRARLVATQGDCAMLGNLA